MSFLNNLFTKQNKEVSKEEFKKNKVVIFLIPNNQYQIKLLRIAQSAAEIFSRVLYLSLNKPAESIVEILKENNIDTEKFLFVDAVQKDGKPIEYHNFIFIDSPQNFEKFSGELMDILKKEKFGCLIFDSLSTLLIYHDDLAVVKFTHDLIVNIKLSNASGEFTCLLEDINSTLVKDISMFADEIINLGGEKTEIKEGELKREQIIKLESELKSVEQAYNSKLISEQSYLKTEERVKQKLRKLRK